MTDEGCRYDPKVVTGMCEMLCDAWNVVCAEEHAFAVTRHVKGDDTIPEVGDGWSHPPPGPSPAGNPVEQDHGAFAFAPGSVTQDTVLDDDLLTAGRHTRITTLHDTP